MARRVALTADADCPICRGRGHYVERHTIGEGSPGAGTFVIVTREICACVASAANICSVCEKPVEVMDAYLPDYENRPVHKSCGRARYFAGEDPRGTKKE